MVRTAFGIPLSLGWGGAKVASGAASRARHRCGHRACLQTLQLSFHTFAPTGVRTPPMLYLAYQTHADIMVPVRMFAEAGLSALSPWASSQELKVLRNLTAAYELITRAGLTHERPSYGIDSAR